MHRSTVIHDSLTKYFDVSSMKTSSGPLLPHVPLASGDGGDDDSRSEVSFSCSPRPTTSGIGNTSPQLNQYHEYCGGIY